MSNDFQNHREPVHTAILLAAGQGRRMGTTLQKQFLDLAGRPLICHPLAVLQACPWMRDIILVTSADMIDYCRTEIVNQYRFTKVRQVVPGGKERYDSVYAALLECQDADYVYIHDGARPFLTQEILERTRVAVLTYDACTVGMPSKDTIKIADENGFIAHTPPRRLVWNIQTPQAFRFDLILRVHESVREKEMSGITDDAMLIESELGIPVKLVEGSYENLKITTPEDLLFAKTLV